MKKNLNTSVIVLFTVFIFLIQSGNEALLAKWRITGDSMGEGVPVFIAKTESKDKSLTFEIAYNTGEPFPAIDIISTGILKFKMKSNNTHDKAVIIFPSLKEYQLDASPSNERIYSLDIKRKEFESLISDFKREKQFTLSIISDDNKSIIIDRKEFDLENAYNAVQDAIHKHDTAMLNEVDFIFPDSGKRILNKDEIQYLTTLSKKRIQVARNEIFARHGFIFTTKDMRDHFSKKKWYKPVKKTVNLSDVEKKNIELIKSAEK